MKKCNLFKTIAVAVFAGILVACASLNTSRETEMLAVKVTTMKVIEANKEEKRAEQAHDIVHVTHEAQQWLTDSEASLADLKEHVKEKVAEQGLPPSDQALADMLVSAINDELQARIGTVDTIMTPEQKELTIDVLEAVESAARVYLAPDDERA